MPPIPLTSAGSPQMQLSPVYRSPSPLEQTGQYRELIDTPPSVCYQQTLPSSHVNSCHSPVCKGTSTCKRFHHPVSVRSAAFIAISSAIQSPKKRTNEADPASKARSSSLKEGPPTKPGRPDRPPASLIITRHPRFPAVGLHKTSKSTAPPPSPSATSRGRRHEHKKGQSLMGGGYTWYLFPSPQRTKSTHVPSQLHTQTVGGKPVERNHQNRPEPTERNRSNLEYFGPRVIRQSCLAITRRGPHAPRRNCRNSLAKGIADAHKRRAPNASP